MIAGEVEPNDERLMGQARELLVSIASHPRFAGSENEARARDLCASVLTAQGFSARQMEFSFSEFPGRYAVPVVSLFLAVVALVARHGYLRYGGAVPALVVLVAGVLTAGIVSFWLARRGTLRLPWRRSRSANLIATRGNPSVWLIAHVDSKSQTIPMLARIASVIALTIALAGLAISLVSEWLIMIPESGAGPTSLAVKVWGIAAAIAALPLILCLTTNKSPGAVDNASGLIAALLVTRLLSADRDIGVIVTSGEELGLAGARAFLESSPQRAIALNCDTIDDGGRFVCMVRGRRGAAAAAVARVALRLHLPLRVSRVLPGILADSIAFADAGWDAITLSRGNLATLTRVHTSSDTRERLNGRGIAQAARLLCATAEELT
jgi:hypothetical protein